MPLKLTYLEQHSVPVELKGFTPDALKLLSLAEIERLPAFVGNQQAPLAELFRIEGDAADMQIELAGDLAGVHWIGAKMTAGTIRVEGPAGRHLGSEMHGGAIHVSGDAGDWAGGEMRGGLIHIRGSAGNLLGAAYRGSRRGMTGGTLLVEGTSGNEIGHTMRRGLISVGGCGDFAGINMIAGTILVFGEAGLRNGAGMRRGTIGLLGDRPPRILPTFRRGASDKLLIMTLVLRQLEQLGYPFSRSLLEASYQTYHGDEVTVGRGELLLRA
jgi:formylmethanofuran dehydrogenase subunit C